MINKKDILKHLVGKKILIIREKHGLMVSTYIPEEDDYYIITEIGEDIIKCDRYNKYINGITYWSIGAINYIDIRLD